MGLVRDGREGRGGSVSDTEFIKERIHIITNQLSLCVSMTMTLHVLFVDGCEIHTVGLSHLDEGDVEEADL